MSEAGTREQLRTTIRLVRERIADVKIRKTSLGEQNTKAVFVEPVMEALGWNLRDFEEVTREYHAKPQDNPVDYALQIRRSPVLFIEAKDLGSTLSDRRWVSQIMGYATVVGVEWCVLTDGNEYRMYNAHAPVDVEEKLFRTVRVTDEDDEAYTIDTLLLLSKDKLAANAPGEAWQAYFVDCQVQRALENMLDGDDAGLVRLIRKSAPGLQPSQIRKSLARADINVTFPTTFEPAPSPAPRPSQATPNNAPSSEKVVVIAGEPHECRYAKDILVHVANWLVGQGKIATQNCPLTVTRHSGQGADRCLVNTVPSHLDGSEFRAPVKLANGLFIETHASRADLERYARRLLEAVGIDPAAIQVRWPTSG